MVVIIVENAPQALRGQLTRWMIEPSAGVYVGRITARVRDQLWLRIRRQIKDGNAIMIYRVQSEQDLHVETIGETKRRLVDLDGFQLFEIPAPPGP
jgi:CRISPR-associated protein Cas2